METKRRIVTVSNAITFLGMVCVFISAYFAHEGSYMESFLFFLFVVASDYIDGASARIIEKRWPGWGISRFGEKFDPARDKSVIIILFAFNVWATLLIIACEGISTYYANKVRDAMRHHFITAGSKAITFFQAIFISLLFFFPEKGVWIIVCVAILSFGRYLTYFRKYRSLKK